MDNVAQNALRSWRRDIYKLMFFCKITGGALSPGFDMQGASFFSLDKLPELSKDRILEGQLKHLFDLAKNPASRAYYD